MNQRKFGYVTIVIWAIILIAYTALIIHNPSTVNSILFGFGLGFFIGLIIHIPFINSSESLIEIQRRMIYLQKKFIEKKKGGKNELSKINHFASKRINRTIQKK